MRQAEDQRWRARVGEVDEVRARCGLLEIEGQEVGGGERPPGVGVG